MIPADPPHHPIRHLGVLGVVTNLVSQESIRELWVVAMRVEERVRQVGLVELGVGDPVVEPLIERGRERGRVPDTTP